MQSNKQQEAQDRKTLLDCFHKLQCYIKHWNSPANNLL